eukprot:m.96973 g.96973  ORF g.96973 m.96973 type:complete len:542 (+) comp13958_c0_seq3:193-1818(+)
MKVVEVPRFDSQPEEHVLRAVMHVASRIEQVKLAVENCETVEETVNCQRELEKWKAELKTLREYGGMFHIKGFGRWDRVCITGSSRIIFSSSLTMEEQIFFIDDVARLNIVTDPPGPQPVHADLRNRIRIDWRPGGIDVSVAPFFSFYCLESDDFVETLGCHMMRYNRRKKDMIALITEAYSLIERARASADGSGHENLLCKLWACCYPGTSPPPWHTHMLPEAAPASSAGPVFAPIAEVPSDSPSQLSTVSLTAGAAATPLVPAGPSQSSTATPGPGSMPNAPSATSLFSTPSTRLSTHALPPTSLPAAGPASSVPLASGDVHASVSPLSPLTPATQPSAASTSTAYSPFPTPAAAPEGGAAAAGAGAAAGAWPNLTVGWTALGFQSATNPAEDLTGSGALAARYLLYFAECYPRRFEEIVRHARCPNPDYPLILVAISLTQLLFNMVHVSAEGGAIDLDAEETLLLRFLCHVGHPRAIEEMLCILLDLYDREYVTTSTSERPEFLMVVHAVKRRLVRLLAQRPMALDELRVLCDWRVAV